MPSRLIEPGGEGQGDGIWLPITEFAVRSGLSLSTIRRKIKSQQLSFRLENGKYLILFDGNPRISSVPPQIPIKTTNPEPEVSMEPRDWNLSWIEKTVQMLRETFDLTLREKEERIRLLERHSRELEEQLQELRLLTRVLEDKLRVQY